ncbi:MAG: imidazole glycerol phosphate synthase subunit HisH [Planctomycetaceae bacterium]|nr:imidazole glycerol phosphate synthase subunit HisH [Planctomycetaceae bacterium]
MIGVIDYEIGNIGSILNMLKKLKIPCRTVAKPAECFECSKLILPGVGAFDQGMKKLAEHGFVEPLQQVAAEDQIYVLGICLGAQMMTRGSEEGELPGLGWFAADTIRFFSRDTTIKAKVPHMGWSDIQIRKESPLLHPGEEDRFYFVHSYHFMCDQPEIVLATAFYGYEFAAAMSAKKLIGAQFHPEKSHRFGMRLLERFAALS